MRTLVPRLSEKQSYVQLSLPRGGMYLYVANHLVPVPKRNNIHSIQVPSGFDIADDEIVKRTEPGDLVITSDIPLADEVITKGALALSSRGGLYTKRTIKARLNIRDFMDTMRSKWYSNWRTKHPFSNRPP